MIPTDWSKYYSAKKNFLVNAVCDYTQGFTDRYIVESLSKYCTKDVRILELGGGNSCFARKICRDTSPSRYDIIDNNGLSVGLFNKMELPVDSKGLCLDLLREDIVVKERYDFVFSIGLVEHFRGDDIAKIIQRHFDFCETGGIVFISFPTPTRKYRLIRRCMERLNVWFFTDEEPLEFNQVKESFERHGLILENFENKRLPLSQYIVVARNR